VHGPGQTDHYMVVGERKRARSSRPRRIVLEASGGYERIVVATLSAAGLPVVRVNPRQTRDFARAHGVLAKTDGLDARWLARCAAEVRPPLRPQPSATVQDLRDLSRRRRQLVADRAAEQQRRHHARAHLDLGFDPVAAALLEDALCLSSVITSNHTPMHPTHPGGPISFRSHLALPSVHCFIREIHRCRYARSTRSCLGTVPTAVLPVDATALTADRTYVACDEPVVSLVAELAGRVPRSQLPRLV